MPSFRKGASAETGRVVAINATATATAEDIHGGLITSTSAAATSITTPTATALASFKGAGRGYSFDFSIDNSAGANTVTLVLGAGLTAASALTGGTTLTVAAGAVGRFRVQFVSATAAVIARMA